MLISEQTPIMKNRLVATIAQLEKQYSVQLEFVITESFSEDGWFNVYHATIGGDNVYGSRTPAIWVRYYNGTIFVHTTSAVNGKSKDGYNTLPGPVELNKWMKMNVTQTKVKNDYQFTVEVNGEVIHRVNNTQTQAFENVKIYISDPWFEAVLGYVRNVFIKGKV